MSLILIDIDSFKAFNDNYGHLAGDDCLKRVAAKLKETIVRPADIVARYGGEEFVVILPETNVSGAEVVAEKLRNNIANLHIEHAHSEAGQYVSISLGVAGVDPSNMSSIESLIEEADKALYEAKASGRNCFKTATKK